MWSKVFSAQPLCHSGRSLVNTYREKSGLGARPNVMLETDLVFADLEDALHALDDARGSPKKVRRAFSRFVELTQRLTAAMRKDYMRIRGGAWAAKEFPGWNAITDAFKWLRNEEQHAAQIRISVHERHFYPHPLKPGELMTVEGTWVLGDQLWDTPSGGVMKYHPVDPDTGQPLPPAVPVRVEYLYLVQPHSEEARERLRASGTTDMHALAAAVFHVMQEYHAYFHLRLGA